MNDFLNPKSMATPGAAGALMMLIANAICANFPELAFRYVAIFLSFAIGSIVFSAATLRFWERGAYWVVNSLIIFSMGVGTSNIGKRMTTADLGIIGEAYAQDVEVGAHAASSDVAAELNSSQPASDSALNLEQLRALAQTFQSEIARLKEENEALQQQVQTDVNAPPLPEASAAEAPAPKEDNGFFKEW